MGLDPTMRAYIRWPLVACALYPWLIGVTHLQRGWFSVEHLTGMVGRATLYKVLLLLACWPVLAMRPPCASGTTVAITLLVGAELYEAWYLHRRRRQLLTERGAGISRWTAH
jgi:O-antigen/teichoic acid export membrane protein